MGHYAKEKKNKRSNTFKNFRGSDEWTNYHGIPGDNSRKHLPESSIPGEIFQTISGGFPDWIHGRFFETIFLEYILKIKKGEILKKISL